MKAFVLMALLLSGTTFAKTVTYSCTPLSYEEALEIDAYYLKAANVPGNLQYAGATKQNSIPAHMDVEVTLGTPAAGRSFHIVKAVVDLKTVSGKQKQIRFSRGYYYDSKGTSHLGSMFNTTYIEDEMLPSRMPGVRYTFVKDADEGAVYLTVCSLTSQPIYQ